MLISKFVHRVYLEEADLEGHGRRPNTDVLAWCRENYGLSFVDWAWSIQDRKNKPSEIVYYFTSKEDAMLFKLMWG